MAHSKQFMRERLNRSTPSCKNLANLPIFRLSHPRISRCTLLVERALCAIRTWQSDVPITAISIPPSSSARWNEPRNTSARAMSSKSSFRSDLNPISTAIRSIFIAASVSSILRRTCFVLSSVPISRLLEAHRRCMSGSSMMPWRFDPLLERAREAPPPRRTRRTLPTFLPIQRNAPSTSCSSI